MTEQHSIIPTERIEQSILSIRGHKVILDKDSDFMFQLTPAEFKDLKSQFGTSSWGGTRKMPRAFTEQGVAMLSSVLRSKRAIQVNIAIMRAFVRLKEMIATHKDLAHKLEELEKKYDKQFAVAFDAIRQLMDNIAFFRSGIL